MTETNPGNTYKESGKINISNYIIFFCIGVALQGLLGIGYGFLSHVNPIIYLNFLILGGAVLFVSIINGLIIPAMKVRNSIAKYIYIISGGAFLLYNAWAGVIGSDMHNMSVMDGFTFNLAVTDIIDFASYQNMSIGKFGRGGMELGSFLGILYVIEMLVIIAAPLYFASKSKEYYCEKCEQNYLLRMVYFTRSKFDAFLKKGDGDLMELAEESALGSDQIERLEPNVKLVELNYYTCKNCSDSIADVEFGITKQDDKKATEYQKESTVFKGRYLNKKTSEFLNSKFVSEEPVVNSNS